MLGNFRISEAASFQDDILADCGHQSKDIYAKIIAKVFPALQYNPYNGKNIKKLKDKRPAEWRYRLGDYRIFYTIDSGDKTVIVYAFYARKDAY